MKPRSILPFVMFGMIGFSFVPGETALPRELVWEAMAPMPAGVAGFASGREGPALVVAGGTRWEDGQKLTVRTTFVYDAAYDRWTETTPLPRAFAFGPFGMHADRLVILGGDDGVATQASAVRPSPAPALPEPVAYAGSAVLNGHLYVLGGTTDLRRIDQTHAHFHALDLSSGDARRLPDFPDGPTLHVALVAWGDHLLAFTGGRWDATVGRLRNSRAAWRFRPEGRTWEPLAPYPFPARGVAACALDDRHVLLAGGYRSVAGKEGVTAECFVYDTARDRYLHAPSLPLAAMAVGLVRDGNAVFALGGEDQPRSRSALVHRADIGRLLRPTDAGSGGRE